MNKEIIEKVLLEISTPTGLTCSGDTTICNDEVKDIMNYINNLEQQCQKQKEFIKWLENGIEKVKNTEFLDERIQRAGLVAYNRVLSKYKEIIGE